MTAALEKAFGYQGDHLHLPVADLDSALPFYEAVLGFRLISRAEAHYRSALLARDRVQIGLAESGGDPTQDGCAFHVRGLDQLYTELQSRGLKNALGPVGTEEHDGATWRVFYVVAPDGLCYWFGERQPAP